MDDLEKLEDLQLDTFDIGKDKLKILVYCALQMPDKAAYDLSLPRLSPILTRKEILDRRNCTRWM